MPQNSLTITGWKSHEEVEIHVTHDNSHVSVYKCKALDCAWMCKLLDDVNYIRHYQVYHNGQPQPPDYLEFSDTYSKWVY